MYSSPYFPELIKAAGSTNALFCLINGQNKEDKIRTEGIKPEISGDISLYQVKFSYPLRPSICVAKNLTLTIQKGESVALVGQSGCGKSTIINLLERFYLANSGEVKFTSYNVNNINLHHLRQNIALVEQEPVLFNGSIMDNVLLGANDATKEDAIRACATAHAQKFIEGFPLRDGSPVHAVITAFQVRERSYDTDVGERGQALSGGQKQRIAIARAIVRNPRVLLLDEATSALDTESEAIIQRALNEASFSRTCIIITHRLTSIFNTDRIYYIEGGSVVESGSHADLMANGGKYAKLVQSIE